MRPLKRVERIQELLINAMPELWPGDWDTKDYIDCRFCGYSGFPWVMRGGEPTCPTCGLLDKGVDAWDIIARIRTILDNSDIEGRNHKEAR